MAERIGLYEDAVVYDILHAKGTAEEVRVLEGIERRFVVGAGGRGFAAQVARGTKARTWLEPACGTGRYLRMAASRGKRVVGFDRSAEMVAYAKERAGERANLFVADMADFASHLRCASVDLAFNLINTIRHLPSDRAMLEHFAEVAAVLRPRGVYVVGLTLSAYGQEFETEDVWFGRRGRMSVRQVISYSPPSRRTHRWERVHSHLVVSRGGQEEHRDSTYGLRTYDAGQWQDLLSRSALRVVGVLDGAGRAVQVVGPDYLIFVLKRVEKH